MLTPKAELGGLISKGVGKEGESRPGGDGRVRDVEPSLQDAPPILLDITKLSNAIQRLLNLQGAFGRNVGAVSQWN
jgi:hypothetical protein